MNDFDNAALLERDFDRLVDNELTDSERRQLLAALDDVPDAWRRCALAFLEAQAWRHEVRAEAVLAPQVEPATPVAATSAWRRAGITLAAMAASFAMAFALGLALRGEGNGQAQLAGAKFQNEGTTEQATPGDITTSGTVAPTLTAATRQASVETIWLPATTDESDPYADLPEALERQLARYGQQLERRQELWPIELQDGRRALLPVERYEVQAIDHSQYQ